MQKRDRLQLTFARLLHENAEILFKARANRNPQLASPTVDN